MLWTQGTKESEKNRVFPIKDTVKFQIEHKIPRSPKYQLETRLECACEEPSPSGGTAGDLTDRTSAAIYSLSTQTRKEPEKHSSLHIARCGKEVKKPAKLDL